MGFTGTIRAICAGLTLCLIYAAPAWSADAPDLAGLWQSRLQQGPRIKGPIIVYEVKGRFYADIAGFTVDVKREDNRIEAVLPGGRGQFSGRIEKRGKTIIGHWRQPATPALGQEFASPVILKQLKSGAWKGDVTPLEDVITLYLPLKQGEDGRLSGFLRNPQRNVGIFIQVSHLERDGEVLQLMGRFRGEQEDRALVQGQYYPHEDKMVFEPTLFGTALEFARVTDDAEHDFYPRSKNPEAYHYRPPLPLNDNWPVSSLADEKISEAGLAAFVQKLIDMRAETIHSSDIHALLIARRGKLVLEEYFHGYHRDLPHDTRSASKSVTTVLLGAAQHAGIDVSLDTPVFDTFYDGQPPDDLDPRKAAITTRHLATMSSGLACDDWNGASPGGEDAMQSQSDQPDWHQFILDLPMEHDPGTHAAYCSGGMNLIGGILERKSKAPLQSLFHNLLAKPLGLGRYHLNLSPGGTPYMGGGIRWRARDFLKLGQLILDEGMWNNKRILDRDFAKDLIKPLYPLGNDSKYALGWWVRDYPYKDGSVTAFFAGGNGGQVLIGFPELDLVILFYGGNYSDSAMFISQREFVPNDILPHIR